jgi:hypothetical protein
MGSYEDMTRKAMIYVMLLQVVPAIKILLPGRKKEKLQLYYMGIDRLPASPATTLLSDFAPGVFRCATTTANKLQRAR